MLTATEFLPALLLLFTTAELHLTTALPPRQDLPPELPGFHKKPEIAGDTEQVNQRQPVLALSNILAFKGSTAAAS